MLIMDLLFWYNQQTVTCTSIADHNPDPGDGEARVNTADGDRLGTLIVTGLVVPII